MKKTILLFTVTSLLTFTSAVILAQESEKEKDPDAGKEFQPDLQLAKIDSAADYQKLTKEVEFGISDNQKTIVDLKARNEDSNKMLV